LQYWEENYVKGNFDVFFAISKRVAEDHDASYREKGFEALFSLYDFA